MSKLDDLIEKLCPDGVEYKELGEILENNSAKSSVVKKNYKKNGKYPIIDQSRDYIAGYTDEDDAVPRIIPCIIFGDHTRIVKYVDQKFAQGESGTKVYKIKDGTTNLKYVYYAFSNIEIKSRGYNRHWSIAKKIKIPIPPKEIQEEIVRILDSFTELEDQLKKEFENRKKQYEFYRDSLLTFGDDVEWKKLEDVCSLVMGVSPKGDTLSSDKSNLSIEFHQGKTFFGNSILFESNIYTINPIKISDVGSLIMSVRAPVGDVNITNRKICIGRGLCSINGKDGLITKFLYYFIDSNKNELKKKSKGSTFESINSEDIRNFKIPIPPLEEQERIVSILDKFDALCNDISIGLPAEIECRKKQYEYYREKLLNFKNISENN